MHNSLSPGTILGNFWMDISLLIQNYALWEMAGTELANLLGNLHQQSNCNYRGD